jgi:hypothetical protein
MATASVNVTKSGTGFTIDVTAANLLEDLSIKDFEVFHDGVLASKADYAKTSRTLLTYSGASLPTDTPILVKRKTPNVVVQSVTYADRFSSSLWNDELDRIIRWREEIDNTAAGGLVPVLIGNNGFRGDNEFDGLVTVTDTTESTSPSTGALVVDGGAGFKKDIFIGGDIHIVSDDGSLSPVLNIENDVGSESQLFVARSGLGSVEGDLYVSNNTNSKKVVIRSRNSGGSFISSLTFDPDTPQTTINASTTSSSASTGALVVVGGVGIGGELNVNNTVTTGALNVNTTVTTGGVVSINNTDESTTIGTGALVVAGGVSIAKDLRIADDLFVTDDVRIDGDILVSDTTESTSITTGAITTLGGAGISKNLYVGGKGEFGVTLNVRDSSPSGVPAISIFNDASAQARLLVPYSTHPTYPSSLIVESPNNLVLRSGGSSSQEIVWTAGKEFKIPSTVAATSKTTGALQVTGGVGVQGNLQASGISFDNSANTLSHYEVGTWAPQFASATTPLGTTTVGFANFIRIGAYVVCKFQISLSGYSDSAGSARIIGLPYSISNNSLAFSPSYYTNLGSNIVFLGGRKGGATDMILTATFAASDSTDNLPTVTQMFKEGTTLIGTITYITG